MVSVQEQNGWGAEFDFGYSADAEAGPQLLDVATYMVNGNWVQPRGRVRPFASLGAGLMQVDGCNAPCTRPAMTYDLGVNFGGVVNGLVTFVPRIKALGEGGHVVNVASMAAYLSGPQAGIYTASKFAVRGLTECLRGNLVPYGIGVSLVCPGLTRTNAWDSALKRPATFAASGFAPPDRVELERFGIAFEAGMDPLEVIKLRDLYTVIEETIDAAEDAAEVIERILAKS